MAGLLQQYGLGLKGINRVKNPLALADGELRTAQNAGISLVRARAGIRKRSGYGLLLPGAGDPLLAILPIPFDDWNPGSPVTALYPPYPAFPGAPYLGAPHDLADDGFTIDWTGALWADLYKLFLSLLDDFSTLVDGYDGKDVGNVLTYTFTGLTPGTPYYVKVVASNDRGDGTASNVRNPTTTGAPPTSGSFVLSLSSDSPPFSFSALAGQTAWLDQGFDQIALDGGAAIPIGSLPAGFSVLSASLIAGQASRGSSGTGQVFYTAYGDSEVEVTPWAADLLTVSPAITLPKTVVQLATNNELRVVGGNNGVTLSDAGVIRIEGTYEIVGG